MRALSIGEVPTSSLPKLALIPEAQRLNDRYEFISELGRGAMGIVYLARERRSGLSVAIKLLDARVAERGEAARNFAREARIVAGLDHPRIVRTLAIEEMNGRPVAIVSEFVRGGTLRAYLRGRGPLPFDRVTTILRDVAAGMAHAHRVRVVHRDVKPENIYISAESGRASLGDFGIARAPGRVGGRLPARGTQAQRTVTYGTPTYMAPEQVRGEDVDERADVYSLALVGWEMLAGARPWEGEPLNVVLHNQQFETLASLATMRPDIPAFLLTALDGAMQKEPADRWSDGGALLARLTPKPVTLRGKGDDSDALTEALTIRFAAPPNAEPVEREAHTKAPASDAAGEQSDVADAEAELIVDAGSAPAPTAPTVTPRTAEIADAPHGPSDSIRQEAVERPLLRVIRYEAPRLVVIRELGARIARAGEIDDPIVPPASVIETEHAPLAIVAATPASEEPDALSLFVDADVLEHQRAPTDEPPAFDDREGSLPEKELQDIPNESEEWALRPAHSRKPAVAPANMRRPTRSRRFLTVAASIVAFVAALATVVTPRGLSSSRADRTAPAIARAAAGELAFADSSLAPDSAALPNVTTPMAPIPAETPTSDSVAKPDSATRPATAARRSTGKMKPAIGERRATTSRVKARTRSTRAERRSATIKSKKKTPAPSSTKKYVASAAVRDERCRSTRESDQEACLKLHTARADASMNDVYQRLAATLSRTSAGTTSRGIAVAALRSEQGTWERTRLTTCQRRVSSTNNALWGLERAPCYSAMARQREVALRARLSKVGQGR